MKTLHKLALIVLLLVTILACSISAPVAVTIRATAENTATLAPEKPANKAKMQAGYTSTVTAEKWLYIRSSASHYAEVVGYLMNGEQVTVLECRGVWGRIGMSRWINTIYLEKGCE